MARSQTASLSISEMREFASFTADEQAFITRSLDVFMARGDAFKAWVGQGGSSATIRALEDWVGVELFDRSGSALPEGVEVRKTACE